MGIFNIDDNIKKIPFNKSFSKVNYSINSRVTSLDLFFYGSDIFHLNSIFYSNNINKIYSKTDLNKILDMTDKFIEFIFSDKFLFNPNENIFSQIKAELEKFTENKIDIEDKFISFTNNIHHFFSDAYSQYMIRNKFEAPGFDHPENVAYIHITINDNIHWFLPINYIWNH